MTGKSTEETLPLSPPNFACEDPVAVKDMTERKRMFMIYCVFQKNKKTKNGTKNKATLSNYTEEPRQLHRLWVLKQPKAARIGQTDGLFQ